MAGKPIRAPNRAWHLRLQICTGGRPDLTSEGRPQRPVDSLLALSKCCWMNPREFTHSEEDWLARSLRKVAEGAFFRGKVNLFICGAGLTQRASARARLIDFFREPMQAWYYDVHSPEEVFQELLVGKRETDLLSLENQLAAAADLVLLVPESDGSKVELGAFANHPALRLKLIVVQDRRFRRSRSFINAGPLRLIRAVSPDNVLLVDLSNLGEADLVRIGERVRAAARQQRAATSRFDISNVLHARHFVLPCLYVLESIERKGLTRLLSIATGQGQRECSVAVSAALQGLLSVNALKVCPDGLGLTRVGVELVQGRGQRSRQLASYDVDLLDAVRVEVLARRCRGKAIVRGQQGSRTLVASNPP
jgi:hypothetical protein